MSKISHVPLPSDSVRDACRAIFCSWEPRDCYRVLSCFVSMLWFQSCMSACFFAARRVNSGTSQCRCPHLRIASVHPDTLHVVAARCACLEYPSRPHLSRCCFCLLFLLPLLSRSRHMLRPAVCHFAWSHVCGGLPSPTSATPFFGIRPLAPSL